MAAINFLLEGGDNYTMLKDLKIVGEFETLDDVLTEYINENGTKGIELGRIKNLAENVAENKAA